MSETDYLVGVEEYELAFVEDVLDDAPVDAQTVYKETIDMSERAIAAEAAYRTTTFVGGGGSPSGPAGGVLGGTYPNPSFAADMATQAELDAHVSDTADAHDASAISILDAGSDFTATDVEGALAELQSDHEADATGLSDHIADTSAAHAATAIAFTPDGSIAATTVQAAIVEVRDEAAGGGAPSTADYLVGTANGGLSSEIVVGATPGGELGGTWDSPTVDATHSGSTHAAVQAAAEATAAAALSAHLTDTADAHDASAISAVSTTLSGTGTDVQAVLEELDNLLDDHSARHENGGADEISIAGLDGTSVELAAHLADTSDAHDASAISILDAAADFTATDVEGALAELQSDHEADATALSDHIADASAAHAASAVSVNSATLVGTGTDAQAVFEELDNGIADHLADSSAAHAASAVSFSPTGTIAATDVQAAIAEVASEASGVAASLFDANTILKADSDDTPVALPMGASTILARLAAGSIKAATPAELRTLLDVPTTGEAVLDTLYDANTVLAANSDDTPAALTMGASTILARLAAGNIKAASVAEIATLLAPSLPGYEWDYVERTTDATITVTSEATASDVIVGNSRTYDGSPVVVEFFCPRLNPEIGGGTLNVLLQEGSTVLGYLLQATEEVFSFGGTFQRRFTPTAASHTYKITAYRITADGVLKSGAGGAAAFMPMFMRIVKV